MVRVLMVRHAESKAQERQLLVGQSSFGKKGFTREVADAIAKLRLVEDVNGDPPLSDNGVDQARLFASYWEPILRPKACSGRLHVYVSPHVRSLQTADPLMQALRENVGSDIHAKLHPLLFETYGITMHPMDRDRLLLRMAELGRLEADGLLPRGAFDERPEVFPEDFAWSRGGLSPNEMRARFEWLTVPSDAFDGCDDKPWWRGRPEVPSERDTRTAQVVDWLHTESVACSDDDLLLLIGHGELTGRVLNVLFARYFNPLHGASGAVPNRKEAGGRGWVGLDPGSNTSTSLLTLSRSGAMRLEFFHRLDHLGPQTSADTLMRGYQSLGLANGAGQMASSTDPVGVWGSGLPRVAPDSRL